jgi:WD40 repeat protein
MRIAGIFNEGRLLAATIRNDYDYENEELNSEILIGEVCVRDLVSGELISRHETTSGDFIHALELASVGNSLLAVSGGKDRLLRIWDVAENGMRESWSTPGQINSVAYSPYGSLVVGVESDFLVMNVMPKS